VGGSYTHGTGISDHETFAWKLQRLRPSLRISNFATVGYGTYQSLLAMERLFAESRDAPELILYGFLSLHLARNVARTPWLKSLALNGFVRRPAVPFVSLGEGGELVRHPPLAYPAWPLSSRLASVNLFQDRYMQWKARHRARQTPKIAQKLLIEMDRLSRRHGTRFVVVFLEFHGNLQKRFEALLSKREVAFIDCAFWLTPKLRIEDGHPNSRANSRWARCIDRALGDLGES